MEAGIRNQVTTALKIGIWLDKEAKLFCDLMTELPTYLHECEAAFSVVKKDNFSFAITAHRRNVIASYGHAFSGKQAEKIGGQYAFYLQPEPFDGPAATHELLLQFVFDREGNFEILDDELCCNPAQENRSYTRNTIMTYVLKALQIALSATQES